MPEKKNASDKAPKAKKKSVTKAADKLETKAAEKTARAASAKPKVAGPKRNPLNSKTFFAKQGDLSRWRIVDAKGIPLGRLSSHVAHLLMGKDKAGYTRFADTGDFVIVVNAKDVVLTGKKWESKEYFYHTNYPGGIKTLTARGLLKDKPEELILRAVYGMLPKGHMGRRWYGKLRVFAGTDHPHTAQKPEPVKLPNLGTWE